MSEAILIWLYLSFGSVIFVISYITIFTSVAYYIVLGLLGFLSDFGKNDSEFYQSERNNYLTLRKLFKSVSLTTVVIVCLGSLYPSKEDLKWIIGGALVWNGVEAASDLEGVNDLPQNTLEAMNHFLKSIQEEETSE